ncbi:MAG: peptide chain release factor N(5)-glutamine methyltransferase [Ruminococcaceae bacterium]|nr:peptide chain release factor N(5)-glutamine methyltransferase [Oscillospiraceae bacterium]
MVIGEALQKATGRLSESGSTSARLDAEVLLSHLLGQDRVYLVLHKNDPLSHEIEAAFEALLCRRIKGEPIAYLTGSREFMSLTFSVSPGVLIPRPDTETLAEWAISTCRPIQNPRILDICTGSGALAISLAHYLPQADVTACDISPHCLQTAQENAEKNGVSYRVRLQAWDVFASCPLRERYHCIVSNPPYIPSDVVPTLERDVRDFEPALALDGGEDGLQFYRRIISLAPSLLQKDGYLAFEVGYDQADSVAHQMKESGFSEIKKIPDLSGIFRVVCGQM